MKPVNDISLDVMKCAMNYMIILLHAWAAFQYVQWNTVEFWSWTFITSHLCGLAMPTFFMISGYLLFQHYCLMKWPKKIQRRVRRLVVPYLVWNSLFVVFYLSLSRIVPRLAFLRPLKDEGINDIVMPKAPAIQDGLSLSRARVLVATNRSTFSEWGAFLGRGGNVSIWSAADKPPSLDPALFKISFAERSPT